MDWITLQAGMSRATRRGQDLDMPPRAFVLDARSRLLDGTMYDHLEHDFEEDYAGLHGAEYVPTRRRRPSVQHDWCRVAVEDAVALLFSEGRFPTIGANDDTTEDVLADLISETVLNATMVDVATTGAIGTAAVLFRALGDSDRGLRVFFTRLNPAVLTPQWQPNAPDTLASVTERYKVSRADLLRAGYVAAQLGDDPVFWFQRTWTAQAEIWFEPQRLVDWRDGRPLVEDASRSVLHQLGFVPVVWIKNLPGGIEPDGRPTLTPAAISTQIEADYQISQAGRGQRYNGEPTLLVKDDGTMVGHAQRTGGSTNALVVGKDGDAKLLEISGAATAAVLDFVKHLRASVLEGMRGNRADANKLSAAQSGRAMELMNQGLIWLADQLRVSYGEGALLALMRMVIAANAGRTLLIGGKTVPAGTLKPDGLTVQWQPWYSPTYADSQIQASTLAILRANALVSQTTAVQQIAGPYGITDIEQEIAAACSTATAADARATIPIIPQKD